MKFSLFTLGLCAGLLLTSGCSKHEEVSKVAPKSADKEVPVAVRLRLVNVLDKVIFDDAHIKGGKGVESINIAMETLKDAAKQWDKAVPVVVYCSNYWCTASGQGARELTELGFKEVWAYEGGMAEWYQLNQQNPEFAIEGPAQMAYLKMKVAAPARRDEKIKVIDAQMLQKMIKQDTLN